MIQANRIFEIFEVEDTTTRCQLILDEIQPLARRVMERFISKYSEKDQYLAQLRVHTYDQTLKGAITDSKNPKYAEKIKNYGKRAFIELIDERYYDTPLNILKLEFQPQAKEIRIYMNADFYPFWVYSKKSKVHQLETMLRELDDNLGIYTFEDEKKNIIPQHEFIETVQQIVKDKKTPKLNFGGILPLEGVIEEDVLVETLWSVYQNLIPVRNIIEEEAKEHSQSLLFLRNFKEDSTPLTLTVFSRTYKLIFHDNKKVITNEFKQPFSLYDQDQLITDGFIGFYHRDPIESIGVKINNRGHIFSQVRKIATSSSYEWYNKKSFYHRGKYNENNENQQYQEKAFEELKKHNFDLNENAFYVGTYYGDSNEFSEPISKIKERLIIAALIFADASGSFTLPKDSEVENQVLVTSEDEENEDGSEEYSSSFEFSKILDIFEQSEFTFSTDIIRNFYLNLTCLDDKHFVILNGISGTGKTQLCRVFANAVYGLDYHEDHPYLKIIAVRPDWMDATALFGYYSSFEKRYMRTEFLDMLLQANKEKDKPHFVVLDEMNLARVEYYLSDYLSAVESRKPIRLHNMDDIKDVPKVIEVPHNFYVIGTINVDETTHSISDKVLDRAFVMTLSDVDFTTFWERLDEKVKEHVHAEWKFLLDLHEDLVGYDLHFGYRTMNEVLRKLYKNSLLPEDVRFDKKKALDMIISEKILPKIRGDERIGELLNNLSQKFIAELGDNAGSTKHIERMRKELERYGAAQFWR